MYERTGVCWDRYSSGFRSDPYYCADWLLNMAELSEDLRTGQETGSPASESGDTTTHEGSGKHAKSPAQRTVERIKSAQGLLAFCLFLVLLGVVGYVARSLQANRAKVEVAQQDATVADSVDESDSQQGVSAVQLPGLYVSPDGDDSAAGDMEHPLSTVAGALARLESMRASEQVSREETYQIWFRGGEYIFDECLFIGGESSNVAMTAWGDEKVVFTAEHPIRDFYTETVNGVQVFVKDLDVEAGEASFKSLFNAGGLLSLSRYPKEGYLRVVGTDSSDALWDEESTPSSITLGQTSFNVNPEELANVPLCDGMQARVVHKWHDELMDVTSIDADSGKVSLSRPATLTIASSDRYCLENVFATMSEPGEWYVDHGAGRLYYVPYKDERPDELVLYAASNDVIFTLDGVNNITFNHIRFARTDWSTPVPSEAYSFGWCIENDMEAPQGAVDVTGVITIRNSSGVTFTNCEFMDLGSTAIRMEEGVANSRVESCLFQNIAASAVFVGGRNVEPGQEGITSSISIFNNKIVSYGRRYYCAPGIQILYCDQADVRNNEIAYGRYSAIACGWVWGYGYQVTNNIQVASNLIYRIGDGSLCDMGAVYTLGTQPGTTITGNVIHNVKVDEYEGYGGWGIYLDEGSSEITVDSNLVFACSSHGYYLHYGSSNSIRNNIFALNAVGQINFGTQHKKVREPSEYINNICLTAGTVPVYCNYYDADTFTESGNLAWNMSDGMELTVARSDYSDHIAFTQAAEQGFLGGTVVDDPLFVDPRNFDFAYAGDSLALWLGYVPWDYNEAGTIAGSTVGFNRDGGDTGYRDGAAQVIPELM